MDDKLFQELVASMEEFNKAAKEAQMQWEIQQQQLKIEQERDRLIWGQLKKEQNRDKS